MLLVGIVSPVVTAATVDLYATSSRGMAVCLSMMFGRLGGIVGSNMFAIYFEDHCEWSLMTAGATLIVCGFLSLAIPDVLRRKPRTDL